MLWADSFLVLMGESRRVAGVAIQRWLAALLSYWESGAYGLA